MNETYVFDPMSHDGQVSNKIVFALERLSHVFRIHWWEEHKNFQLSPLQMQLLVTLQFQPTLDSVSAMATYLKLSNATVSDAVRVLIGKGYIDKWADAEDGRRHHLRLTQTGQTTAIELSKFANQIRDFVLTMPNQEQFLESLLHLMHQLQQSGFIPLQQMCPTCHHFRQVGGDSPYYCQLLQQPLLIEDLRIHCQEHELVA